MVLLKRQQTVSGPSLDVTVFERVLSDGSPAERMTLGLQLAEFATASDTSETDREAVRPYVLKLLSDPVRAVRAAVAELLSTRDNVHPDIVFTIVADEEDIALPFLEGVISLHERLQLAIFRAGDAGRRTAIAGRADLSSKVIDFIAMEGDKPTVMKLLDNTSARIGARNHKRLYVRFREDADVVHRLLGREDLPLEVRMAHVAHVAERMRERLKSCGLLPVPHSLRFIDDEEEKALADILARAGSEEDLASAVAFAVRKGMLTPALLLRAGCRGQVKVLEQGLAHLSGTSLRRVRAAAGGSPLFSLRSICRRAGLPDVCFTLVRAILELAAELREKGATPEHMDVAEFGIRMLERAVAGYEDAAMEERGSVLDLVMEFADGETASVAERMREGLRLAA